MSSLLHVATRKGLFTIARRNAGWQITDVAFLGIPVTAVFPDPRTGQVIVALKHGHFGVKLHRSEDGEWPEIGVPTYSEKPADCEDIEPVRQMPVPLSTEQVWVIEAGADAGELWCGTIPGGLFRSTDRGQSWKLNRPLWDDPKRKEWFGGGFDFPGIHSIDVDPRRNGERLIVGVSCGGVWKTEDRGETWQLASHGMIARYMPEELANNPNAQDPHRVVQSPSNPDVLWSQHHSGIFRSTDASVSWQEVGPWAPSSFGFTVAVHPQDADTGWFAPASSDENRVPQDAQLVVVRTRDGGQTNEIIHTGLPQQHAYDLTFRHALGFDSTGESLAFGSTTGGLWISDNQGDSFETISQNLPPVYAVRFASK